jgi:hypothetical protein
LLSPWSNSTKNYYEARASQPNSPPPFHWLTIAAAGSTAAALRTTVAGLFATAPVVARLSAAGLAATTLAPRLAASLIFIFVCHIPSL